MDIIVTILKSEIKNTVEENKYAAQHKDKVSQFYKVSRKPTKLEIGDKVFICKNGEIDHYHIFLGYQSTMQCEVTKRTWMGLNLKLKYPPIKLKNPIKMKGFRGFKYSTKR